MMKKKMVGFVLLAGISLSVMAEADQPKQICAAEAFVVRSDFPAGRMNGCEILAADTVRLTISPEDEPPINPSPWYGFRVEPKEAVPVTIEMVYKHAKHRYWPKISQDGKAWAPLKDTAFKRLNEHVVRLSLPALDAPLYVAGQEMLTVEGHQQWMNSLAERYGLTQSKLGESLEGRPIHKLEKAAENGSRDYVVFVGRQHPPEVTGALALMPFAEAIFADTPLANRFREQFGVMMVPVMNPDGVTNGHWRHSVGDKDLNRDWGPFTQPETKLIEQELKRFSDGDKLHVFLDFHSTRRNVLYTQAESEPTKPEGFTRKWVAAAKARIKDYEFERDERPWSELPTSKNYVYATYGVPAITYEVGDETDRRALANAAKVFAEEMMRILLDAKAN